MGLRSKIRERQQFKADPLGQNTEATTIEDGEVDERLDRLDDNTAWLCDLTDAMLGDNEDSDLRPSPVWLPNDIDPSPLDSLPAGAVRNRDDVYPDGNRCAICHVPTLLDVCVGCATEPKS